MRTLILALLVLVPFAGCLSESASDDAAFEAAAPARGYEPHVIVGIPDSGINPYHQIYYREGADVHPSHYIKDFPPNMPALELTVGAPWDLTWEERFEADKEVWEAVKPDVAYWIPHTAFVAVMGEGPECDGICILDDTGMHGTGTTSSVLTENPGALIAFKEGGSGIEPLLEAGIPVDLFSVSWGYIAPLPIPQNQEFIGHAISPIYVKAAGNDPRPGHSDGWTGDPRVISVGGAYAADHSEEVLATKQPDIVSYYCRPTAQTNSVQEMRESYCGTSFAAPTAAGALSKVILAVREASGYLGSTALGMVDPVAGVSIHDLREALNRTASYDPEAQYETSRPTGIPRNEVAPWVQWGWGFYDGLVAEATIAHLMGDEAPEKPAEAVTYMETLYQGRQLIYG